MEEAMRFFSEGCSVIFWTVAIGLAFFVCLTAIEEMSARGHEEECFEGHHVCEPDYDYELGRYVYVCGK